MNLETFEETVYSEWDRLQTVITRALPYLNPDQTEVGLISAVLNGRMFFVPLDDAFVITSVQGTGDHAVYWIELAGGNWETINSSWDLLEAHAKTKNCKAIEASCRLGFLRSKHQKQVGMKPFKVIFRKEL